MTAGRLQVWGVIVAFTSVVAVPVRGDTVLEEDFDRSTAWTCLRQGLTTRSQVATGSFGTADSKGVRVAYRGSKHGSRRVVFRCPLPTSSAEQTLEYSVRFNDDFQFVKGGKLPGLGPQNVIAGGNPMTADGWSVRPMFLSNGRVSTYLYHQDKLQEFGDTNVAKTFRFRRERYYRIALYVKVNSSGGIKDGIVRLYIDEELKVERGGIRLRGTNDDDSLVSKMVFATFHGGSSPKWAPRDSEGAYATVHADFDDFRTYDGQPQFLAR